MYLPKIIIHIHTIPPLITFDHHSLGIAFVPTRQAC